MKASDISRLCRVNTLPVSVFDEVTSTNDICREREEDCAVIAERQTQGRGRKGRSFLSREGGLYLSVSHRITTLSQEDTPLLTVAACVAVCRGVERVCGLSADIKWVNDLLVNGKKVCGILAEGLFDGNGGMKCILGIGINVFTPAEALAPFGAASLLPAETPLIREKLAAALLDELSSLEEDCRTGAWLTEYRRRSAVLNKSIRCFCGTEEFDAVAEEIDERGGLQVRLANGECRTLCSGEITVRLKENAQ